ncbi:MAG: hypothetical protein QOF02_2831 [Blastocatellia bacterium]|jgi:hypothetical protein|nr:hypothetical protein [Blastocatellia bacterium]
MSDELNSILETKTEPPTSGDSDSPGGIEGRLSAWGMVFLVLGIVAGIICIIAAVNVAKKYGRVDSWGERGIEWYLVIIGVAAILHGMLVMVLLEAAAEIIRLLRKLNNK